MTFRIILITFVLFNIFQGCTPTKQITYSLKSIDPVSSTDSMYTITRNIRLYIEPFEDIRESVPENGMLFVRDRITQLYDKDYCLNVEEHYTKNAVPIQIAKVMSGHLEKRKTFKSVSSKDTVQYEYILTGKLKRLYGEQELSSAARAGSYFGLIGALATSGATTNGTIIIEFTDLVVHRKRDGAQKNLQDMIDKYSGELHADGECWCIYDNVNHQIKSTVEKLSMLVEKAVAELELSKP